MRKFFIKCIRFIFYFLFGWMFIRLNAKERRIRRFIIIGVAIALFSTAFILAFTTEKGWEEIWHVFTEHYILEILVGVFLYFLLEDRIEEYGKAPLRDGKRNYHDILQQISKSKRDVRILDNDFSSFFEGETPEQEAANRANLIVSLTACLDSLDPSQKLYILLLHPDTMAARQRHEDLGPSSMLFDKMNAGFQFLVDFENKLPTSKKHLYQKMEVKLFKTSFSVVFASWDEYINFSVLPPEVTSDQESFKTLQYSQLSNYLIDNFDAIWKKGKTVTLKEYKQLEVHAGPSDQLTFKELAWGHDNYDHDLPTFVTSDSRGFKVAIKNGQTVEIKHDGRSHWAKIYPLEDENKDLPEKSSFRMTTLFDHGARQIHRKSGVPLDKLQFIYQIQYINRHRIMLLDDQFVYRHLEERGYCYAPHTRFDVYLGRHLTDMMNTLSRFFLVDFEDYLNREPVFQSSDAYKRIFAVYTCTIGNQGFEVTGGNNALYHKHENDFYFLPVTGKNRTKEELAIDSVLRNTIEADIMRILGVNHYIATEKALFGKKFDVLVQLIRCVVTQEVRIPETFPDPYVEHENKAAYLVVHSAGRKYVKGGLPKIYKNNNKEKGLEPERIYNLQTALDSVYVKHAFKGETIKLSSSSIIFDQQEYLRADKKREAQFQAQQKGPYESLPAVGYRNIIVVEFFHPNETDSSANKG